TVVAPAAPGVRRGEDNVAEGDDVDESDPQTLRVAAVAGFPAPRPLAPPPSEPRTGDGRREAPSLEETGSISPTSQARLTPPQRRWIKGADTRPIAKIAKSSQARKVEVAPEDRRQTGGNWIIQIGATDDAAKANALLARARGSSHGALADAKP